MGINDDGIVRKTIDFIFGLFWIGMMPSRQAQRKFSNLTIMRNNTYINS